MNKQPLEPAHSFEGDNQPTGKILEIAKRLGVAEPVTPTVSFETAPVSNPRKTGISRRAFVGASALALAGLGVGSGVALSGLSADQGSASTLLTSNTQMGHLLRKAGFGATPADLRTYSALSFSSAIERLIDYQQVPDDLMEQRLKSLSLDMSKVVDQQHWWVARMAWTQRPLLEKMTLFWHGVLTSSYRKVGGKNGYVRMFNQNQFLREHAFDTLDTILLGITGDPAMLVYLDLGKSTRTTPNENYARELMELFTLGVGNYTQADVHAAALALTGWRVVGEEGHYQKRLHDSSQKTYLGHTGNLDYKDVVQILTNHSKTPEFLCRKLFTFFVYENPSAADLHPLIDAYHQNKHSMGAVMRALLLSPQFSSSKAYRSRIKSPVEFAVGAYRSVGMPGSGNGLQAALTLMGQTLFDPPNVAGWPGDKVSSQWLNSGTWMTRLNFIDRLLAGASGAKKGGQTPAVDLQKMVSDRQLSSPESFVDYFSTYLLDGTLEADRRQQMLDYFKQPGTDRNKATIALGSTKYPLSRARGTLYLLMSSPDYQLN